MDMLSKDAGGIGRRPAVDRGALADSVYILQARPETFRMNLSFWTKRGR